MLAEHDQRGLLLEKYYQRRKERLIGLVPSDFDGKLDQHQILNIAGQLADHGLIHWRPNPGHGGIGGGMGTITAAGIAVVEGQTPAPLDIHLMHQPARQPPAPSGAMTAHLARQSVAFAIDRLAQAIDDSDASEADKRAATALLRAFQEHPLLRTMAHTPS
jgi:hypothetical protein